LNGIKIKGGYNYLTMNQKEQLQKLEKALQDNFVRIIYDVLKSEGGLCKVKNQYYLIINRNLSLDQKIELLSRYLIELNSHPALDI
jgi:hypothetical protein